MLRLGVNIDHVATLRQARYARMAGAHNEEPALLDAALDCEAAGAHSITVHLREDRRHIQDRDVSLLRDKIGTHLNLEMGNASEIVEIALRIQPDFVCLVPENRQEITTEGGLDVAGNGAALTETTRRLQDSGIKVSLFIDPHPAQVEAAAKVGAEMIELHTGAYANALGHMREEELRRLVAAGRQAHDLGLQVNAGHGITTANLPELFAIPSLAELNIGHHIISRSIFVGLRAAVEEMLAVMARYPESH
jgi:pyridoxine 5-phosphate synthase